MTKDEFEESFNDLMSYEWDSVGYSIMQCYPHDQEAMYRALCRHKAHLEKTKQIQTSKQVTRHSKEAKSTSFKI